MAKVTTGCNDYHTHMNETEMYGQIYKWSDGQIVSQTDRQTDAQSFVCKYFATNETMQHKSYDNKITIGILEVAHSPPQTNFHNKRVRNLRTVRDLLLLLYTWVQGEEELV